MELTKAQKHYRKHREKRKLESREYYRKKRIDNGYSKVMQRDYLRIKRADVLKMLGSQCVICGFSDYRALQIDHINGGGSKERKERKYVGSFHSHVMKSIKVNENKYQLLCANCNWIKRFENNENKK